MNTPQLRIVLALATLVFVAVACSAPPVSVRRTALVPLPSGPTRTGRPLEAGEVRFAAQVARSLYGPEDVYSPATGWALPRLEDPGVRMPRTTVGGSIYGGVSENIELGLSAAVGPNGQAEPNFFGHVINFDALPSLRVAGGLRANIYARPDFVVSLVFEAGVVRVPQATFRCVNATLMDLPGFDPDEPISGWCTTNREFGIDKIENHARFHGSALLEPVYMINDMFSALVHVGVSQSVRNIGFEPLESRSDDHTLDNYAAVVVGGGAEARFRNFFVGANFDVLIPTVPTIGNLPTFVVTTGPRIPSRAERRGVVVGGETSEP